MHTVEDTITVKCISGHIFSLPVVAFIPVLEMTEKSNDWVTDSVLDFSASLREFTCKNK